MAIEKLLFIGVVWVVLWVLICYRPPSCSVEFVETKDHRHRHLRPRGPKDCPLCQVVEPPEVAIPEVVPWSELKSRRGRPKQVSSEGQWCPNEACAYYGIEDEWVHAVVANGVEGEAEAIQRWLCQACGRNFSGRHHTAMHHLKTPSWRVQEVVTALGEGVDQAAAERIFRHHSSTITRWLGRAGQLDEPLHDHFFGKFVSDYIQLDELKTKTRRMGETWVWVALDVPTRVMLALHLGPRTQESAYRVLHEVKQRLVGDQVPVFSSDGLRMYFYGITAHFGSWVPPLPGKRAWQWVVDERVLFAQLHKHKVGYKLADLRSYIRLGTRWVYRQTLQALGFSGKVETAYVERQNLTLRELIAPLSRRTWSLANDEHTLALHIGWGRVYYHFARPHHGLRYRDARGRYRLRTPAMAAKVVPRRLQVAELLLMPLPRR